MSKQTRAEAISEGRNLNAIATIVSGKNADGTDFYLPVDLPPGVSNAAVTSVGSSTSDTTLQASNTARRGLMVFNGADKTLYLKYGSGASSSSYTVQIAAGGYWEMPQPCYTGAVNGAWASSPTGNALVTEVTP